MTPEEKKRDTALYRAIQALIDDMEVGSETTEDYLRQLKEIQLVGWPDGVRIPYDPN